MPSINQSIGKRRLLISRFHPVLLGSGESSLSHEALPEGTKGTQPCHHPSWTLQGENPQGFGRVHQPTTNRLRFPSQGVLRSGHSRQSHVPASLTVFEGAVYSRDCGLFFASQQPEALDPFTPDAHRVPNGKAGKSQSQLTVSSPARGRNSIYMYKSMDVKGTAATYRFHPGSRKRKKGLGPDQLRSPNRAFPRAPRGKGNPSGPFDNGDIPYRRLCSSISGCCSNRALLSLPAQASFASPTSIHPPRILYLPLSVSGPPFAFRTRADAA